MKTVLNINKVENVDRADVQRSVSPAQRKRRLPTPVGVSSAHPFRRSRWKKQLKHIAVYAFLRSAAFALRRLPHRWALAVGGWLGDGASRVDRSRFGAAADRLGAALGLGRAPAVTIARANYVHLGRVVVEVMRLLDSRGRLQAWVRFPPEDQAILRAAVAEGRGVVIAAGHVGNWELLGPSIAAAGFDGAIVVRSVNNRWLDRWLVRVRGGLGLEVIARGESGRIAGVLRRGGVLGLMVDMDTAARSVSVPFFGRRARTPVAAAALALRGRPLLVATIIRAPDGRHRIALTRVCPPPAGPAAVRRQVLMAAVTALLESRIREHPAQWTWPHDRWRD